MPQLKQSGFINWKMTIISGIGISDLESTLEANCKCTSYGVILTCKLNNLTYWHSNCQEKTGNHVNVHVLHALLRSLFTWAVQCGKNLTS